MARETTRTRLSPDQRREQILVAAIDVFSESDYSAVSLEQIAERANVTRGLVHHYFGSKRDLYLEAVERCVRVPADIPLVPDGLEDANIEEVLAMCVSQWLQLVKTAGGLWVGFEKSSGGAGGGADVAAIFTRSRDDLVDRMITEVPFPEELDESLLRGALRSYAGLVIVATDEWLTRRTLTRAQTHSMLTSILVSIVLDTVPAMMEARTRP